MAFVVVVAYSVRGKLKAVHRGPAAYGLGASGMFGREPRINPTSIYLPNPQNHQYFTISEKMM
jgi:hypothetical protein